MSHHKRKREASRELDSTPSGAKSKTETSRLINAKMYFTGTISTGSARLEGYFGDDYVKKFGSEFVDFWIDIRKQSDKTVNIFDISITKYNPNVSIGDVQIKGDIRMCTFYFIPKQTYYSEAILKSGTFSEEEKQFFKGTGYTLLCLFLEHIIEKGWVNENDVLTLEASGGNTIRDMMYLVKYYEALGFKKLTDDKYLLRKGYEDYCVPMYAKISSIIRSCKVPKKNRSVINIVD